MTKKKMPINSCYFDCDYFKAEDELDIGDMCLFSNRIVYCDEECIEHTSLPVWCPRPTATKIIDKCEDCNQKCGFHGYCWKLKRVVDVNSIDRDCPLEDYSDEGDK